MTQWAVAWRVVCAFVIAGGMSSPVSSKDLQVTPGQDVTILPGGFFGYLFKTANGTLIVNGYIGRGWSPPPRPGYGKALPGPGYPLTVRSVDAGRTWQIWAPPKGVGISPKRTPRLWKICQYRLEEPAFPHDDLLVVRDYCSGATGPATEGTILQLKDRTILMYDYEPEPLGDGQFVGKMWRSRDDWNTVEGPEETYINVPQAVDTKIGDHGFACPGMMFWGPALELPNGDLLTTMYGWFKEDTVPVGYTLKAAARAREAGMTKMRSILVRSRDQGRTWDYYSTISAARVGQEGPCETSVIRLTHGKHPGRLIAVMRVGRIDPIYQAESDDDGKTWGDARPLNVVGVAPSIVEMRNGVLAMSFGHKPDYRDDGIFVAFSLDQGQTWTHVTRISSAMTGAYTTLRELAPGELFVVYDEVEGNYYRSPLRRILGHTVKVQTQ